MVLLLEEAVFPTSNAGTLVKTTSGGSATTNTPAVTYNTINFTQDATDQTAIWNFEVPADYLSGPVATLLWGSTATTGNHVIKAGLSPSVTGTTDSDQSVYLAADSSGAISVPSTAGVDKSTSISLTAAGAGGTLAAGQMCSLFVGRDADHASDTASGTLLLRGAVFSYTS